MEQQENNNLSELDQLKAQYETLKQQFDQQEILNDKLMKSSIKNSVNFYKRYRWFSVVGFPLLMLIGLLIIKWDLGNHLSTKVFWATLCITCMAIELLLTRKLQLKTLENDDLLTLSNQARGFKKLFAIYIFLNYSTSLILISGFLLAWMGNGVPNMGAVKIVFSIAIVFFVLLGIAEIRYKTKPCDEIIRQIEASEATEKKKINFDKKQKRFCIVMIVVFLGFDIWAYIIVGSYLKLPLVWRTMQFVREADDLSTEGALEFWEVYADTLVAEEDVPIVMEKWQQGDSLVVMRSNCQPDPIETRHDASLLYVLKKTTPEGPAISSAVLHGKPMVACVTVTYPHGYPNNDPLQLFVFMTSEARQLWYRFTTEIAGHRTAIVMDGEVIQDWKVMCGIENGKFMIMREWSSKEELEAFCERLIKQ